MKKLILSLLVMSLFTVSAFYQADIVNTYLPFDSGFSDTSGKVWTNSGASISNTTYEIGSGAAYFNGSAYLTTADSPDFYFGSSDFSVDFWIYLLAYNPTASILFGQSNSAGDYTSRSLDANISASGNLSTYFFYGSNYIHLVSSSTIPLNAWRHINITRSNGTLTQNINDVADGQASVSGLTSNDSSARFSIGRVGDFNGYYLNGFIDEFRISRPTQNTPTPTPTFAPTVTPTAVSMLGSSDTIPLQYQGKIHLFVLAGQSNMVGHDAIPSGQATSATVFNFGNDDRWHMGAEPIDDSNGAIDAVSNQDGNGYGPGMAFALRLQELKGASYAVGLIPCAKDASSIDEWQRSLAETTLYGSCLKRIKAASVMGSIDGVFFYQGETDAQNQAVIPRTLHNNDWGVFFGRYVSDIRADVGQARLPVVFVQIGNLPAGQFPYASNIQQEQAAVSIPGVMMVSAIGLPQLSDGIHLTTSSEQSLGRAAAEAWNDVTK